MLLGLEPSTLGCGNCPCKQARLKGDLMGCDGCSDDSTLGSLTARIPTNNQARAIVGAASTLIHAMYALIGQGAFDAWFVDRQDINAELDSFNSLLTDAFQRLPSNDEPVNASVWKTTNDTIRRLDSEAGRLTLEHNRNNGFPDLSDAYDAFSTALKFELSLPSQLWRKVLPPGFNIIPGVPNWLPFGVVGLGTVYLIARFFKK